ncbi:MAG: outer membrane beta-barrel protein, partial [Chloroflexi bacterium]|nr:outer membrane beta-barrel protein [Chloroflexota bacterium]
PADQASASGFDPYMSVGMAWTGKHDTRFVDGRDSGHAALYGDKATLDAGEIDEGVQFHLAAGTRMPYRLRAELQLGLARALRWRGNTNYRNSGVHQPSKARLDSRELLLAVLHDFAGWNLAPGIHIQPFLGAGLGVTDYRLRDYIQRFPEPDDPSGYLRRGPGGETPSTSLPRGSGQNFTWMATAGTTIPIRSHIHLDLSYRYTDAGEIRTDTGDINIVRYREDGTRRDIQVPINRTRADYRTRSLLASLRFRF